MTADSSSPTPNTQHPAPSSWRTFEILPGETGSYEITRVVAHATTAFQDVEIV